MCRAASGCVILGFLAFCLAACHAPVPADSKPVKVVAGTEAGVDSAYRLQVGDSLTLHFFSFPDLDDTATVGPDGRIALRLVGDYLVAGMTLADATKETNDRYEKVLRHPGISIVIRTYALQQVFVDGEVNAPGVIRSTVPLTASGAIAQAGGMKLASARGGGALLLRRRPDGAIVYYRLGFHGDLPGSGGDPILRTNDLIYVPRKPISAVADFVQANITRVIPIVVTPTWVHTF